MAVEKNATQIPRSEMTPVLQNTQVEGSSGGSAGISSGDIPVSEVTGASSLGAGFGSAETFPQILPDNPMFNVPANPLLPERYREVLDYNSIQYLNGILRTQIGRYVRVQQLVGSNIIQDYDGFLIGVGINYIILQDYSSENIRMLDIYGIKDVYVYYSDVVNPITRT